VRDRVLSRRDLPDGSCEIISRMTVGMQPLQVSYTNRTRADRIGHRISVDSADGPMRHLKVLWRFDPSGDHATHITLAANYEFRSPVLETIAGRMFARLFGEMVDAFEHRAAIATLTERRTTQGRAAGGTSAPGPFA
jgi:ribosome-associated toxin RatA of RatAB toxin-antitoxin module